MSQAERQAERNKLVRTLESIEKTKAKMVDMRDKLRNQVNDLEDILESMESGVEAFDDARRLFDDGLDEMSKHL